MKVRLKQEIISFGIATVVLAIILTVTMGLTNSNLRSPFEYTGDVVGVFSEIKNLTFGHSLYNNPNLAAPFGSNQSLTMKGYILHYLFIHILAIFTKDAALILNAFYLLTFFLIMSTSYIAFRLIKVNPYIAAFMSVIYSCLPYHFFRYEQHIYLGAYYIVPLACISLFWLWTDEIQNKKYKEVKRLTFKELLCSLINKKMILSLIFLFLMGMTDFYYSAFIMILLVFVSVCTFINKKQFRQLFYGVIHFIVLICSVGICLVPMLLNYINYGSIDTHFSDRTAGEFIYYSLNITQLLLPIQNHRIEFLDNLRKSYDEIFLVTENSMSSLGLILAIGLVVSVLAVFCKNFCCKETRKIKVLGKFNIFLILLSVSGGLSFFVGVFITASVRCYNRTVVFIAFFSAMAIAFGLMSLVPKVLGKVKGNIKKKITLVIFSAVGIIVCVVDQIPKEVATGSYYNPETGTYQTTIQAVEDEYYRDKAFIQQIESIYSDDVSIFQYPIVTNYYSNIWPNGNIGAYNSMRPYLHSSGKSSWSYGAIVGDKTDLWLRMVSEASVSEQLKVMSLFGFDGIFIDSNGYNEDELDSLLKEISEITDSEYISTTDKQLYFFNIKKYADKVRNNKKYEKLKNKYMIYYEFGDGFYEEEFSAEKDTSWNWGLNKSQIVINNLYDEDIKVTIRFKMNTLENDKNKINLEVNGEETSFNVNDKGEQCEITIRLKKGNNILNFSTSLDNKKLETDERELCICVENFNIDYDSIKFVQ